MRKLAFTTRKICKKNRGTDKTLEKKNAIKTHPDIITVAENQNVTFTHMTSRNKTTDYLTAFIS
jgi:hypothetical protein